MTVLLVAFAVVVAVWLFLAGVNVGIVIGRGISAVEPITPSAGPSPPPPPPRPGTPGYA